MNNSLQEPTRQVSARRKLIRGAFSVPAVLAVHNGSALAASSNKMQCAVNALSNPTLPTSNVMGVGVDSWIRVQRYKRTNNGGVVVPVVRMTEINAMAATLGIAVAIIGVPSSTQFIRWSNGNILSPNANNVELDTNNLVALRFDAGGQDGAIRIVGIVTQAQSGGNAPPGTNAIAGSCWNSMM